MRIQRYIVRQRTCRNTTATPFAVYAVIRVAVIIGRIALVMMEMTHGADQYIIIVVSAAGFRSFATQSQAKTSFR